MLPAISLPVEHPTAPCTTLWALVGCNDSVKLFLSNRPVEKLVQCLILFFQPYRISLGIPNPTRYWLTQVLDLKSGYDSSGPKIIAVSSGIATDL